MPALSYMGIVNMTPDSFSDGGQYNHPQKLARHLERLCRGGVEFLDIGAESTASFNAAISEEQEWQRYKTCWLPYLETLSTSQKQSLSQIGLSIDSYRPAIVQELMRSTRRFVDFKYWIWNDVSGQLDAEAFKLLERMPELIYVLGHNLVPHRSQTSQHMQFVEELRPEESFYSLKEFLQRGRRRFIDQFDEQRLWLDPCFGFSKSAEQCVYLSQHLEELVRCFPLSQHWLLGLSKKSFLRWKINPQQMRSTETFSLAEIEHRSLVTRYADELCDYTLHFRVHDLPVEKLSRSSELSEAVSRECK